MKDQREDLKVLGKLLDEEIAKYGQKTAQAAMSWTGYYSTRPPQGVRGVRPSPN